MLMPSKDDEIGGLWESATKDGKVYLRGKIDGQDVVLFRNEWKKEGERTPDWRVYKSQPRDQQATPQPTPQPAPRAAELPAYAPEYAEDDSIPF
jgi:uncharacterized protein (DUF736 family)